MCNRCGFKLGVCRCDSEAFYDEFHKERLANQRGEYYDPHARTGRSTRIAINLICETMQNPRRTYSIIDHTGSYRDNVVLMNLIGEMTEKLGLKGFNFNRNTVSMRYDPPKGRI